MQIFRSGYSRMVALIATISAVAFVCIPLLGTAQDSTPVTDTTDQLAVGQQIYENVCIACHQANGNGVPGIYLPLNNNPLLTNEDPTFFIATVLEGRGGMPNFNYIYSDEEIAAIVSYVRQGWDNDAAPVTADQVTEVRNEVWGTPVASPTPEGQRPGGNTSGSALPAGTPGATP